MALTALIPATSRRIPQPGLLQTEMVEVPALSGGLFPDALEY